MKPKGLHAGAAIGRILFIPESEKEGAVHAIGESINIAARLQGKAKPNQLVIANKLRNKHFGDRADFAEGGTLKLKNIGDIISWKKDYSPDAA